MIHTILKYATLAATLFLFPLMVKAQISETHFPDRTRNVIWHTPCGAARINGLAVGIQALRFGDGKLTINGLNADAGLVGFIGFVYAMSYELKKGNSLDTSFMPVDFSVTTINGVSISMGGEISVNINGINIAGGITSATELNGVSITGGISRCKSFEGVSVSGLRNKAYRGRGIQVSLFNNCSDFKGLQIGLWNKSGKRGLPLINWSSNNETL